MISPRTTSPFSVADLSAESEGMAQNQGRNPVDQVLPRVLITSDSPPPTSRRNQPIQNRRARSRSESLTPPPRRNPLRQARKASPIIAPQRRHRSPPKLTSALRRVYPTTLTSLPEEQYPKAGAASPNMEPSNRKSRGGNAGQIPVEEELGGITFTSSYNEQERIPQQHNQPITLNPRQNFRSVSSTSNERSDDQLWQSCP